MKSRITFIICVLVAICAYPQKDVTQFLGIPIDGSKSAMIHKLKAKGFRMHPYDKDVLSGSFNGTDVNLHIATNNNKVCRIMLCDANPVDERSIQIRFNNLCRQFENNPKYISFGNSLIDDEENISYEISIKNKRYEAVYYQRPVEFSDTTLIYEKLLPIISEKFTPEELANPTDVTKKELTKLTYEYLLELCSKKSVWFMISDCFGMYYITMFYDNEYNRANGEDL